MNFVKIRLKKEVAGPKIVYFRVKSVKPDGTYFGWAIDPKTFEEIGCTAEKETYHLIHHAAIKSVEPIYQDIKYGGITKLDVPAQKKKYGY